MSFPDDLNPENERDRQRLALTLHITKRVVGADGVLDDAEAAMMREVFPDAVLEKFGFVNEWGAVTDVFLAAVEAAKRELPEVLSEEEKREVVGFFHRISNADGDYDEAEQSMVMSAASLLGLPFEATLDFF